jgi:hypothetical protein
LRELRPLHAPRGFERKGADELQQREIFVRKALACNACKRA